MNLRKHIYLKMNKKYLNKLVELYSYSDLSIIPNYLLENNYFMMKRVLIHNFNFYDFGNKLNPFRNDCKFIFKIIKKIKTLNIKIKDLHL